MGYAQRDTQGKQPRRDRWWVVASVALVLWVGLRLAFSGLDAWPGAVLGGVVYAGWMSWWIVRRRRADAGSVGVDSAAVPALDRRIMKGDIPDDPAERQAMGRLARRRREKLTRARGWAFPLLAVMFFGGSAFWFVVGEYVRGGVMAAFSVVFLGWLVWMNRRALRKIDRVESQLRTATP